MIIIKHLSDKRHDYTWIPDVYTQWLKPPWTHVGPGRCVPRCSGLCRAPWRQSAGPSGCCGAAGPAGCGTSEPGTAASEHAQTLLRDSKNLKWAHIFQIQVSFSVLGAYFLLCHRCFPGANLLRDFNCAGCSLLCVCHPWRAASAPPTRWWGPGRRWWQSRGSPECGTGCSRSPR